MNVRIQENITPKYNPNKGFKKHIITLALYRQLRYNFF